MKGDAVETLKRREPKQDRKAVSQRLRLAERRERLVEDECMECGHSQSDHKLDEDTNVDTCYGDGVMDNGDPICTCDEFQEFDEDDASED